MIKKVANFLRARFRKFLLEEKWLDDYVKMGMRIGENVSIQPGVIIDYSHCWLIKIGNIVTIAPQVYLLAHDASTKKINNYTKIGSINIEDNVFIGASALILPGVTIGENSIVAAGSVVTKSVSKGSIVAGNPAKEILSLENYIIKNKEPKNNIGYYDSSYTLNGRITGDKKIKMFQELINRIGFVK